ncbi:hypothetical protein JCM8547_002485 [Rhodosporidiobolus lusitaniae]
MPASASANFRISRTPPAPRPVSTDSSGSSDEDNAERSLSVCAASFYDEASDVHTQLDTLSSSFSTIRALSARLYVLHPNSLETPTLALDLRDALLRAAEQLRGADEDLFELWREEERVRLAVQCGKFRIENTSAVGSQEGEVGEREDEVKGLVRRFARRVKEVKREARGERKDRKEDEERKEPERLMDYLEEGVYEFPHLLTKDTVHASRWVVSNPFTILARLHLKSLKIPQMLSTDSTPATFVPITPPPLYPVPPSASVRPYNGGLLHTASPSSQSSPLLPFDPDPTPVGHSPSGHPLADWKADILSEADAKEEKVGEKKPSLSRRFYDEVDMDVREGVREVKVATGRGHRERWIVFLAFALFPILLIANLIEDLFSPSGSSTSSSSASAGSSLSFSSLAPTLMADASSGAGSAVQTEAVQAKLRERRRRSGELDEALV